MLQPTAARFLGHSVTVLLNAGGVPPNETAAHIRNVCLFCSLITSLLLLPGSARIVQFKYIVLKALDLF